MFNLKFATDNEAFRFDGPEYEAARILRQIADKIEGGNGSGVIHDINGNRIGEWSLDRSDA